jgi:hypothetical protein
VLVHELQVSGLLQLFRPAVVGITGDAARHCSLSSIMSKVSNNVPARIS